MKKSAAIFLTLAIFSSQLFSQSESEICRRLFVSAGEIAGEAKLALDLAAQAVWGASEMNGNTLTLTGTLTQTNPTLDTWSYSSTPANKLVVQFYGATPIEIAFSSFDGWLQGTWEDFTNSHGVDFTIAIGTSYNLHIQSQSIPHSTEMKYIWERSMTGTLPFNGEVTTVDLTHSGTTTYELSSGYAFHDYEEQCTGSYSSASTSTIVSDQYFALIRHDSNRGMFTSNRGIHSNSSTTIGGNTYSFLNGHVQWAGYTTFPDSANEGSYNQVLDSYYWQASGSLTKNNIHLGTVAFDRTVIDNTSGPLLVLQTTGGQPYLLHPLLNPFVTGIIPSPESLPASAQLHENYPNPFNPETTIAFELATGAHVTLEVFDGRGRRVATLVDGVLPPGHHVRRWNAGGMASGVYSYTLRTGRTLQAKTMLLLR